jgi:hypothetical protein
MKHREERLESRIVRGGRQEHADAPHALGLLRARTKRPRGCCAPEKCDEVFVGAHEQELSHFYARRLRSFKINDFMRAIGS